MTETEQQVLDALAALGIAWTRHEHPPVFTVEEAGQHWAAIDATHCKNLFLRNKTGHAHYLVVAERSARVDLKQLTAVLGEDRLSFGSPERLLACLGLTAGSVSPFGLLNDAAHAVTVVVDEALRSASRVAFHPNVNTSTVTLTFADFARFLASRATPVRYASFGA